jgi:hypothetical protein
VLSISKSNPEKLRMTSECEKPFSAPADETYGPGIVETLVQTLTAISVRAGRSEELTWNTYDHG